jgi:hypothetical protein
MYACIYGARYLHAVARDDCLAVRCIRVAGAVGIARVIVIIISNKVRKFIQRSRFIDIAADLLNVVGYLHLRVRFMRKRIQNTL